ncbi:probable malate:quinone oxidoreductase (malate dehydrogenase (acceptor)) [Candidatus Blochmanniella floridana]|uniref:Probable malate:quinone oxidoreductase n=1 Tax=Blochmanniella floridana TaxID=203907 RepID=MQO_BLOFL|nr:RecName: Full=Probable malate:quinone oxidoreductase; AltName: Full=MQO; AltName: Full=Malate dehydrogenase [quinone] [Candidatus Blochmannia floridanus]CAD83215.1 probable malate:quinone oxidoreductase (malate dehydrogenase (acceptor)) [Candidatus Blochmannia floridanus]
MKNSIFKNKYNSTQYNLNSSVDIVLVGAGIMSVTLGSFLTILEPSWIIHIYERLNKPAQESSNSWNNAGTGHAAFCELNYTKYNKINDSIDITKALSINTAFELSLQFWAFLTKNGIINNPKSFINNIPHISFVWGQKNINFLKKRFQTLQTHNLFHGMIYSEDPHQIKSWIPLVMTGRNNNQKVAATYMPMGTDINFEEITTQLLAQLKKNPNFNIYLEHDVTHIERHNNKYWKISVQDIQHKKTIHTYTKYVFIGAGGKSLNLLQTANIQSVSGYAGFPVGGQFLVTYNPEIVSQHQAKVYGKANVSMPPMSVPHIDTRILNNKKVLLFGPFATFSSKFLKYGSWLDLFHSLNKHNLKPIIQAGIDNFPLIKYLFNQLIMSNHDRINALKEYYPEVNSKDWFLIQAGQRVQIIKKNNKNRGILQFGTEIVSSADGSLSALLGASPGASISVSITIKLLNIMFQNKYYNDLWKTKLIEIVPSYINPTLNNYHSDFMKQIRKNTRNILKLIYIEKENRSLIFKK